MRLIQNSDAPKIFSWVKGCTGLLNSTLEITQENVLNFIMRTASGTYSLGVIDDKMGVATITDISIVKRSACIKYLISAKKGQGVKLACQVTALCFNNLNLFRVYAKSYTTNLEMEKIFKAGGYRLEGEEEKADFINGEWVNKYLWAAFKEDVNWKLVNRYTGG